VSEELQKEELKEEEKVVDVIDAAMKLLIEIQDEEDPQEINQITELVKRSKCMNVPYHSLTLIKEDNDEIKKIHKPLMTKIIEENEGNLPT
jgi:hypothetical protein